MKNIKSSSRENDFNVGFQNNQAITFNETLNNLDISKINGDLETGIDFIDNNTHLFKGNISLFAGRVSSRKEELFVDIALNIASKSKKVAYFSFGKNLDEEKLVSMFKKKCSLKNLEENILNNIHIVLINESSILRIVKELSEIKFKYGVDAVFIDDDKSLLFGDDITELRNNYELKNYLSWEISQMAKLFNVHIFIGARVKAKFEQVEFIEDIDSIKYSFGLRGLSKFILGVGHSEDENIWNISFLKNSYGDVDISSKVNIN